MESVFEWVMGWATWVLSALGLRDKKATIVLLGLDNAGKSSLIQRLSAGRVSLLPPTQRPQEEQFTMEGIVFKAWDLGGHEAVRNLWDEFTVGSSAVIFVIDAADEDRLEEAKVELEELLGQTSTEGVPVAICYNKCDRHDALASDQLDEAIGWKDFDGKRIVKAFRISVLTATGYKEAFRWIAQYCD